MLNLQVQTMTTTDRTGTAIVLITAVWLGKVVECDSYRASDMTEIEKMTLKARS